MGSRSTPSVRPLRSPVIRGMVDRRLPDRDPPALDRRGWTRKAVCRRCSLIITDCEPMTPDGDFCHVAKPHQTRAAVCVNANRSFGVSSPELTPFMRKARRRALKRRNIRP